MDWERIGRQWREQAPDGEPATLEALRERDRALWRKARRRDLVETLVALVVVVVFAVAAQRLLEVGNWLAGGSALLIVAWAAWLPFRLHRGRRLAVEPDPGMPLLAWLEHRRDALLAQARMLEQIWSWYLAPPAIGAGGLKLGIDGLNPDSLAYFGFVLVLYAVIGWLNRRAARTRFRARADELQARIDRLTAAET